MIYQKFITVVIGNRQFMVASQNPVILLLKITFTTCFKDISNINIKDITFYELYRVTSVGCKN